MRKIITALKNCFKRCLFLILVECCFNNLAVAQKHYYSWDFSDCEIKDILYAVSLDTGISIVPDDTVSGKGDLKFVGQDFSAAFDAFLNSSRLYVQKNEKLWTVSRFASHMENGFYYVDACDLTPVQLVEKLSVAVDKVITFDSLPGQRISVHFKGIDEITLMESLCKRFGNYEVVKNIAGYHLNKKNDVRHMDLSDGYNFVELKDDGFSVDVKNVFFGEVVEKLFEIGKSIGIEKSFCMLASGEVKLQRAVFNKVDLTEALEKLCLLCGYSFLQEKGIFYFFQNTNSKNTILNENKTWKKYCLNYTKTQDFLPLLYKTIGKNEVIEVGDGYSFISFVNEEENLNICNLIEYADNRNPTFVIKLKYLKPEELISNLPPNVDKSSLYPVGDCQSVYFKGSEKEYESFLAELEVCDKKPIEITYDLLILQYDETTENIWSSSFDCKRLTANSRNNVSAVLGSVMGLNMNVISAFGLNFAAELQSSIEECNTKVYADTTLHGIPGKQISFQNTNTYRYRDNNVNPETGAPIYSGVTREISSGIKLDVVGWVSGDGMITSKVTASVSRQGNDTSATNGNPPPTSEKIVTTEVCGKSGEPVILSGLVLNSDSNQQKRTPFISKIPLIGNFFKSKSKIKENSQMIIYLVPHLDNDQKKVNVKIFDKEWVDKRLEGLRQIEEKI